MGKNIKTPDGGFYFDNDQVEVNYEKNLVSIKPMQSTPVVGKSGAMGNNGRKVNLQKSKNAIEYKYSNELNQLALYKSEGSYAVVGLSDVVKSLGVVRLPVFAKYVKVKTVTIFGANASGEELLNLNYGQPTPPETNLEFLGGFSPKNEPVAVVGALAKLEGNMNIGTVKQSVIPEFSNPDIVSITRISVQVQILDNSKNQLGDIVNFEFIIDEKNDQGNWIPLVQLSEITGPSKQGVAVENGTATNIAVTVNALLDSLRNAGLIAKN